MSSHVTKTYMGKPLDTGYVLLIPCLLGCYRQYPKEYVDNPEGTASFNTRMQGNTG